jgi:hypothetical protein
MKQQPVPLIEISDDDEDEENAAAGEEGELGGNEEIEVIFFPFRYFLGDGILVRKMLQNEKITFSRGLPLAKLLLREMPMLRMRATLQ